MLGNVTTFASEETLKILNFNDRIYADSINSYRPLNLINIQQCYKRVTNDRTLRIALDSNINSFLELVSSSQKAPSKYHKQPSKYSALHNRTI